MTSLHMKGYMSKTYLVSKLQPCDSWLNKENLFGKQKIKEVTCTDYKGIWIVSERFLGFSICRIRLSDNSLTSLIWVLLFLFSCLIALARRYSTMLSNDGKSEHPSFVYTSSLGKHFHLSPLSVMLAVGHLHKCPFMCW